MNYCDKKKVTLELNIEDVLTQINLKDVMEYYRNLFGKDEIFADNLNEYFSSTDSEYYVTNN